MVTWRPKWGISESDRIFCHCNLACNNDTLPTSFCSISLRFSLCLFRNEADLIITYISSENLKAFELAKFHLSFQLGR